MREYGENEFTPYQAVVSAVESISEPWAKAKLPYPSLTVLEVSRVARLPQRVVIKTIQAENNGFALEDLVGQRVNGNYEQAAIACAPHKRVARKLHGGQHAFEVLSLNYGIGRLRITHYPQAA